MRRLSTRRGRWLRQQELDLGLDYLARRPGAFDEDRAVDAVRTVAMGRLFRVGVSLMTKVRTLATELRRGAPFAWVRA